MKEIAENKLLSSIDDIKADKRSV